MSTDPAVLMWLKRNWPRTEGLILALASVAAGALAVAGVFGISAYWFASGTLILSLITLSAWAVSRRLPRIPRGKVGIAVAINSEADANASVKADFLAALRTSMGAGANNARFQIVEIPEYAASRLLTTDDASRCMRKVNATFFLYGSIRSRKLGGADHEILDVVAMVSHAPIDLERAGHFAREFSEVFPRRFQIQAADAFAQVEFTGTWAGLAAKYIIAIAAGISDHLDFADKLLQEVQAKLTSQKQGFLFAARLAKQIPELRERISFIRTRQAAKRWYETKSSQDFESFEKWIKEAKERSHDGIVWQSLYALYDFCSTRNTAGARQALEKVPKTNHDAVWFLNMAFLEAFDGDLRRATRCYRKAAEIGVPVDDVDVTVGQIEHFLVWQLEIDPNKFELHYCLGCLNRDLKGDLEQARKDFQDFLNACPTDQYNTEQTLVRQWIDSVIVMP